MKKMMLVLMLVTLSLQPNIRAEEHELPGSVAAKPASPWSYSMSELLMSKYYGSIFGGTFYPGPMSFGDLVASRQNKLGTFTIDLSIGQKLDKLDSYNKDGGTEYDLTLDQTFKFGPKAYPILADVGVCYLVLSDIGKASDDAFEEFARLDFPIMADRANGPICQFYVEGFHYHTPGKGMKDEGWYTYGGVFRDQKLGCKLFGKELVLNVDYRMGATAGAYESNPGVEYHRLAFSLPLGVTKHTTVVPSVIGQIPNDSSRTFVHKSEVFATLLIKYTF